MNYNGAEGLEFGGGNTKVDPSVAESGLRYLSVSIPPPLNSVKNYRRPWRQFLGQYWPNRRRISQWRTAVIFHQGHIQRSRQEHDAR